MFVSWQESPIGQIDSRIKEGDIISIQVAFDTIYFYVNNRLSNGVFKDERLIRLKTVPFVFLGERLDQVDILEGSTDPLNY